MVRRFVSICAVTACVSLVPMSAMAATPTPIDPPVSAQVVGGSAVPAGGHPYAAYVRLGFSDGQWGYCSGVLVAPRWVATAAHCMLHDGQIAVPSNSGVALGAPQSQTKMVDFARGAFSAACSSRTPPNADSQGRVAPAVTNARRSKRTPSEVVKRPSVIIERPRRGAEGKRVGSLILPIPTPIDKH